MLSARPGGEGWEGEKVIFDGGDYVHFPSRQWSRSHGNPITVEQMWASSITRSKFCRLWCIMCQLQSQTCMTVIFCYWLCVDMIKYISNLCKMYWFSYEQEKIKKLVIIYSLSVGWIHLRTVKNTKLRKFVWKEEISTLFQLMYHQ